MLGRNWSPGGLGILASLLLAEGPWASYLTLLGCFYICKMVLRLTCTSKDTENKAHEVWHRVGRQVATGMLLCSQEMYNLAGHRGLYL